MIESPVADTGSRILEMVEHILADRIDGFFSVLRSIFSAIPYNIFIEDRESYYHTVIYLALSLVGVNIRAEVQTHSGPIDAVLETETHIYVIEFKLGSAQEALNQIKTKKYYAPYMHSPKNIKLIGASFNIESRNICLKDLGGLTYGKNKQNTPF